MSVTSLGLMQDDTVSRGVWGNERMWISVYAVSATSAAASATAYIASAATSFTGDFMCGPQDVGTYNLPNLPELTVTVPFSAIQFVNFSNMQCNSASHWVGLSSYESPPLSEEELTDLAESENELKQGKGKHFRDVKSLLADLDDD